jgi:hypothetical protein
VYYRQEPQSDCITRSICAGKLSTLFTGGQGGGRGREEGVFPKKIRNYKPGIKVHFQPFPAVILFKMIMCIA